MATEESLRDRFDPRTEELDERLLSLLEGKLLMLRDGLPEEARLPVSERLLLRSYRPKKPRGQHDH